MVIHEESNSDSESICSDKTYFSKKKARRNKKKKKEQREEKQKKDRRTKRRQARREKKKEQRKENSSDSSSSSSESDWSSVSISDSNDHRDTDNYSPFDFETKPAYENEQEISNEPLCSEEINACNEQKIHQAKTCILSKINNIRRKVYLCISKNKLLSAKAHAENYRTQIFRFVSRFEPAQSELKERSLKTLKL